MADEKSPADEDVMKDTVEASEIRDGELDDDVIQGNENEEIDTSDEPAELDDGDSASLETQVEELKEALIRSQANTQLRNLSRIYSQYWIRWIEHLNLPRPQKVLMRRC